jgi:hypothetical protein
MTFPIKNGLLLPRTIDFIAVDLRTRRDTHVPHFGRNNSFSEVHFTPQLHRGLHWSLHQSDRVIRLQIQCVRPVLRDPPVRAPDPCEAGATALFRLPAAQKVFGVAPAQSGKKRKIAGRVLATRNPTRGAAHMNAELPRSGYFGRSNYFRLSSTQISFPTLNR